MLPFKDKVENKCLFNSVSSCPSRDFAQKAKSRGGTLVTRAYIKESTYSWNIQSVEIYSHTVNIEKISISWTGDTRNR